MNSLRLSDYPIEAEPATLIGRMVRDLDAGEEGEITRVLYSPSRNEVLAVVMIMSDTDGDGSDLWMAKHPDDVELVMDS